MLGSFLRNFVLKYFIIWATEEVLFGLSMRVASSCIYFWFTKIFNMIIEYFLILLREYLLVNISYDGGLHGYVNSSFADFPFDRYHSKEHFLNCSNLQLQLWQVKPNQIIFSSERLQSSDLCSLQNSKHFYMEFFLHHALASFVFAYVFFFFRLST